MTWVDHKGTPNNVNSTLLQFNVILWLLVETFGPEYRPIVEFAVDNVQTLKQRNAKLQAQQRATRDDQTYVRRQSDETSMPDKQPNKRNSQKRKSRGDETSTPDVHPNKRNPKKGNPEVMIDQ
jgi:hypothetical protein